MKTIPKSKKALVIRTDYSCQPKWIELRALIEAPIGGFRAYVEFIDDPEWDGLDEVDLIERLPEDFTSTFMIVADGETFSDPEMPLLIVDLREELGRTFRAIPIAIQSIENNLSISNMDFEEFAAATDSDGVFRGFAKP